MQIELKKNHFIKYSVCENVRSKSKSLEGNFISEVELYVGPCIPIYMYICISMLNVQMEDN